MRNRVAWLLLLSLFVLGCSQDEPLTSGEKTAERLENIIRDNNITTASVVKSSVFAYAQERFSIQSPFIVIGTTYYNCDKLLGFELRINGTTRDIVLYFE